MLEAAGLRGTTPDGSTAGQHVVSLRSSTLLCLVSSQQPFNGVKNEVQEKENCSSF